MERCFSEYQPTVVVLATARVGGIHAKSTYPAGFLLENLRIQTNLIERFCHSGVLLLFLSSSSIYPKCAEQPIWQKNTAHLAAGAHE